MGGDWGTRRASNWPLGASCQSGASLRAEQVTGGSQQLRKHLKKRLRGLTRWSAGSSTQLIRRDSLTAQKPRRFGGTALARACHCSLQASLLCKDQEALLR